jgi:SAM-dependent methyltransferase
MQQRLQELNLVYLAPCDCGSLPFEPGSVDIVISRDVLEHIPPPIIENIFREAHRILRAGGIMLHLVDHSDHWSHRDSRINAVNFLRYPDWLFKLTCVHPQHYQNRLRHSQYRTIIERTGFRLKSEEGTVDPECLQSLSTMPITRKFRSFDSKDLATVNSILLAEPLEAVMKFAPR